MKACAIAGLIMFVSATNVGAQSRTTVDELQTQGARQLSRDEVERIVLGSQITITDASGTRSWTNWTRRSFITSLHASTDGEQRPVRGKGMARVVDSGAYCVRIQWPSTLESWCRHIFTLDGAYYGISNERGEPGEAAALPLQLIQPDLIRLHALTTMWYLSRSPGR